jgi:hypothetical protein
MFCLSPLLAPPDSAEPIDPERTAEGLAAGRQGRDEFEGGTSARCSIRPAFGLSGSSSEDLQLKICFRNTLEAGGKPGGGQSAGRTYRNIRVESKMNSGTRSIYCS